MDLLTFVLKKLLVELIDDFSRPSSDLIANQVNVLLPIIYDLLLLLKALNIFVKLDDFESFNRGFAALASLVVLIYFKSVEILYFFVILESQLIKLFLIVTYGSQKLSISLLSGQELGNHLLNVSIANRSPNLLKHFLKIMELFHLTFHLLFEEFAPQLLDTKVCSELNLILILVFICSCFGDF